MSATALATQTARFGRPTVKCDACRLVQFMTMDGLCVRPTCRQPYNDDEPEEPELPVVVATMGADLAGAVGSRPLSSLPTLHKRDIGARIAVLVVVLRGAFGLSQAAFAKIMGVNRTYISKIENRQVPPNLASLEGLTAAFGITIEGFILMAEAIK